MYPFSSVIPAILNSLISGVFTSSFLLIAHIVSLGGGVENAPEIVIVCAVVVVLVISFTSTLEFLLYCTITGFPESSNKFIPASSDIKGLASLSSKITSPLLYVCSFITADSCCKKKEGSVKIIYKLQSVPTVPLPGKSTSLSRLIEEVVEPVESLPLDSISTECLSCTLITSPGRKKEALIDVVKETISVSFVSVAKCQAPNLFACPSEVHPKATTSFDIILP